MTQGEIKELLKNTKEPLCVKDIEEITGMCYGTIYLAISKIPNIETEERLNHRNQSVAYFIIRKR